MMTRQRSWTSGALVGVIAVMVLGGGAGFALADDDDGDDRWVKLGEVKFDAHDRTKEKRVSLDFDDSAFTHLKLKAKDSDVRIRTVVIQFDNGDEQVVNLDDMVEEDDHSRTINLKGDKRLIDRLYITGVTVDDDDDHDDDDDAIVKVYGIRS